MIMKFRGLITVVLVGAIELIPLTAVRPSLAQSNLNTQLNRALCTQDWGRAIQIIDQMKKVAGPQYASQLTLYRGQLEAIARENVRIPGWTTGCAGDSSNSEMPGGSQPMINPGVTPEIPGGSQPMINPGATPEIPGGSQPMINPGATPEIPGGTQPITAPEYGGGNPY
jgi:hypothetical protein